MGNNLELFAFLFCFFILNWKLNHWYVVLKYDLFNKYVTVSPNDLFFSCCVGTPCYVDSEGIVRMLNRGFGNTWTPVCNTREHCKGKSDHYWVVGIHENPQQLRWAIRKCLKCVFYLAFTLVHLLAFHSH